MRLPINLRPTKQTAEDISTHFLHVVEEKKELKAAIAAGDTKEILDGLGDVLWTTASVGYLLGYNVLLFNRKRVLAEKSKAKIELSDLVPYTKLESVPSDISYEWFCQLLNEVYQEIMSVTKAKTTIEVEQTISRIMNSIYISNMSKLCNKTIAKKSIAFVKENKGVTVKAYRSPLGNKWYLASETGRIYKPMTFKEPVFKISINN